MAGDTSEFGTGLQNWGPQAFFDYLVVKMMMSKVGDVIPRTYVPILRLVSEDAGKVDDGYASVLALREPIAFLDSPRERWRKTYGAYIRELEWVYGELRQHFPTKEYQDLVQDIMARNIKDAMSAFLPTLEKMQRTRSERALSGSPAAPTSSRSKSIGKAMERLFKGRFGSWMFSHMNPMSFMVGPVDMQMEPGGEIKMWIPRCWMHTAPGDGQTQDQACVQGCKGACERVFNGNTPIAMHFEPHLPDFSCTLRVKMSREVVPAS
jgi:hypothetical protein